MIQIVIPAAGVGSRLKEINPLSYPKLLVEICGKTFLERLNHALSPIKDKEFIFILGSKHSLLKEAIEKTIKNKKIFHLEVLICWYKFINMEVLAKIKNIYL